MFANSKEFVCKSDGTEIIASSGTSRELCHGLGPRSAEGHPPSKTDSLLNSLPFTTESQQKIPWVTQPTGHEP